LSLILSSRFIAFELMGLAECVKNVNFPLLSIYFLSRAK
jgi:hypothetical protein